MKKHDAPAVEVGKVLDENGNRLMLLSDGTVVLKLYTEFRSRKLGYIQDGVLHVERNSAEHTHRKTDSYGFNYHLLKMAKKFTTVHLVEDDVVHYHIPVQSILDYGKILHFKYSNENSFELQIFLSKKIIKNYKK